MRPFDLIVFDWDGTLCDSRGEIIQAMVQAFRDCGLDTPDDKQIQAYIGLSLPHTVRHLLPDCDPLVRAQLIERYRYNFFTKQALPTLYPGVRETLQTLYDQDYYIAIATGKGARGLKLSLEQAGLCDIIHASCTAEQSASKPAPDMLHMIMAQLAVEPERTLMVGDTTFDMELAHNAHVACCAVSYGNHQVADLQDFNPLRTLDRIDEILNLLSEKP